MKSRVVELQGRVASAFRRAKGAAELGEQLRFRKIDIGELTVCGKEFAHAPLEQRAGCLARVARHVEHVDEQVGGLCAQGVGEAAHAVAAGGQHDAVEASRKDGLERRLRETAHVRVHARLGSVEADEALIRLDALHMRAHRLERLDGNVFADIPDPHRAPPFVSAVPPCTVHSPLAVPPCAVPSARLASSTSKNASRRVLICPS